jgi:hypothetical protein
MKKPFSIFMTSCIFREIRVIRLIRDSETGLPVSLWLETLNLLTTNHLTPNRFTPETILETLKAYNYQALTDRFTQNEIFTIRFFFLNRFTVVTHGRASPSIDQW